MILDTIMLFLLATMAVMLGVFLAGFLIAWVIDRILKS